ncbi:cell division cycle protein 48 [Lojkania enalia]|uniref:Cell division cycle protein 48 n=1 Tax=Lojkania enalia TaxID=147567 RepID=A0A9P4K6P6_9PLEO|nr:cell division cycle protein 48 [Didymosphaeria enalia]
MFTLRPTERNPPGGGLEGAFRLYLTLKDLKILGISTGDLVTLASSSGKKGFGIAWLASQTNPGNKPIAKVTDMLREKYEISLNDRVSIEKAADSHWKPADSIEISCPGALEYNSNEELLYWVRIALVRLELVFSGSTFDIQQAGPKFRQRSTILRATIENIEPSADLNSALYIDPVKTRITLVSAPTTTYPLAPPLGVPKLDAHGIGGLSNQIEAINEQLRNFSMFIPQTSDKHLIGNTSFLIHGPEGTGKTLLLERLSQSSWRNVFRLDQKWLASNPKAHENAMSNIFREARECQPSLVLFDSLDRFLEKAPILVGCLKDELEKLEGLQVAIAATARSLYDIDASLRTGKTFNFAIEIFPPNTKQREDMLRQIIGVKRNVPGVDFNTLAERSHGFVGRDIHKLCNLARRRRYDSLCRSMGAQTGTLLEDKLQAMDFITQVDFDAVMGQVEPTVLKDHMLEVPKVRWTDIAGLDDVREHLEAMVIRPIKYPELEMKFGGTLLRKGLLMYGPPGCAKTLMAQAIATESNQNFLAVKGSELVQMYVGESERAIRNIFRRARAARPCIIFFDEIDSIGKSRGKTQDSGLNIVTTLLNEMDGIEALKQVFIIAATNRPDILDSALIRPGRFDAHIHIGLPNQDARKQIFQIHTRKMPLAADIDLTVLASRTEGSSGADIKGLCAIAADMALTEYTQHMTESGAAEVRMAHFERALNKHVPHTVKEEAEQYKHWRPGKVLFED